MPEPTRPAPDPELVRGTCLLCRAPLVSRCYYVDGRGYLIFRECWESLASAPACDYRRVL